ncbi:MAG: potassium-transporting ATPase subunit KdpA [Planctomycetes bacterium]|nr:potassium-transporting ATPase subunit KdpA [Planctomycetota bacterium]
MWLLPLLIVGTTVLLSFPLGRYLAWIMDGKYKAPAALLWIERQIDTGPQNWKQYCYAMLLSNAVILLCGFLVLATQPWHPVFLNPDNKGMLSPTTIFNTACSFLTNTNLQHYSGEVHLSYASQLFAIMFKQFITPAIGLAALLAVIRGLRGDDDVGNYFLDVWRGVIYVLLPLSLILAVILIAGGCPITLEGNAQAMTVQAAAMGTNDDGSAKPQGIARGPVAAVVAIKQLGTNGGGFFGVNSAHPLENPTALTNFAECVAIILLPMACLVMFGRMIRDMRHAGIVFAVALLLLGTFTAWAIYHDTTKPNPALLAHTEKRVKVPGVEEKVISSLGALPVDQSGLGNLEGKELRFGPSAGATWSAITTCTSNGSVNCMHDSLNPNAGLTPLAGMWLNCNFGGVGVGLINMLVYLVVAVFLAGLMVGRTPEYLGRKVEAREMKLAMLAMLIHPLMILGPTGVFAALEWGKGATNNPGAHGFSEILYEFTSASANNGSGFEGLGDTYGFNDAKANPSAPATYAPHWDIATGLVMVICRFIPIIAPIALAAGLARKKKTPFTSGTMRTDTATFGFVLLGTIILVGALLFLPAAVLGPVAEHYGPMPFGR